jgi:VWFA-related protein
MRKLLAGLFLGSLSAAPSQLPEQPTFRVGTRVVEVDVVAHDRRGPAIGLTKADFTLLDNGKPREIAFFSVRSAGALAGAPTVSGPAASSAPSLPPGAISNRAGRGEDAPATQTVLLLDRLFTAEVNQIIAIQRIGRFLDLRRKRDGVGIYSLSRDVRVIQDVTADDRLLRRAADSLKAEGAVFRNSDTTGMTGRAADEYSHLIVTERVAALKHALQAIARHLANIPGRKGVVWITEAFPLFYCPPHLPCTDYTPDMQEAARALNDANVALYAVDPRGLIGALGRMTGISNAEERGPASQIVPGYVGLPPVGPENVETMHLLAGLTGGAAYYNTNGLEDSMLQAVEDGDVTYSLGFYPPEDSQDGKVHKLKVNIARAGVSLRYRESYFAAGPQAEGAERPSLERLLRDPLDATQIGLVTEAQPDPARPGFFNVRVSVDLHDLQFDHQDGKWIGAIDVAFGIENAASFQVLTRTIEIPDALFATALEKGIAITHAMEWQSKAGRLRVVVEDKVSGAAGSLRVPLGKK